MEVSKLSDEELHRAMIWLNPPAHGVFTDDECGVYSNSVRGHGCNKIDYLEDWSLTGPLMVKYGLNVFSPSEGSKAKVLKPQYTGIVNGEDRYKHIRAYNYNTLRAICEVILMIEMANES